MHRHRIAGDVATKTSSNRQK